MSTFSDLAKDELGAIAAMLEGTSWLATFACVSRSCKIAVEDVESRSGRQRKLRLRDVATTPSLLAWSERQGCPLRSHQADCSMFAAEAGSVDTLRWLKDNGFRWQNPKTCLGAALRGHLEVLKWARANGCDWDSKTCSSAASEGHLEVVKWARANGCE